MSKISKTIRVKHPELGLIIKADLEWDGGDVAIKAIRFGLPQKASKLEKLLLKYVDIYCYDVFRTNNHDILVNSKEYQKFVAKGCRL